MGRSRNPPEEWDDIQLSAFLNRTLGVSFITPWNIGELPEHWIEMIVRAKTLEAELRQAGRPNNGD